MFQIVRVLGRSWFGTKVVVEARSAMRRLKQLLRFHHLFAPGLDAMQIEIDPGETFTLRLPGGPYRVGQLLEMEALMNMRLVQSRWTKTGSF